MLEKICPECKKRFEYPEYRKRVYCSNTCKNRVNGRNTKGHPSYNTKEGIEKAKRTLREGYKSGRIKSWNKGKKGLHVAWNKGLKLPQYSGKNSGSWKENPTHKTTYHLRAKKHRKDYCEKCSIKNIRLEAHHIDGNIKNNNPKNIMTLCNHCHKIIDQRHIQRIRDKFGKWI